MVIAGAGPKAVPQRLRIHIEVAPWSNGPLSEPFHLKVDATETRLVDVAVGDPLLDRKLMDFSRMSFQSDPSPLILGSIIASDRAWVRMSRSGMFNLYPAISGHSDSVVISTSWRNFGTESSDAGCFVRVRIVPDEAPRTRFSTDTLLIRSAGKREPSDMETAVERAEVVGVFRLVHVSSSVDSTDRWNVVRALRFRAEDVWVGSALKPADTLTAWVPSGLVTDTSWTYMRQGTPMVEGRPVILFLNRTTPMLKGRWTFPWYQGYGLFDHTASLVFWYPIRGERRDRFKRRVEWAAWRSMHPFEGRVFGRIVSDASGQRLAGVQASMPDDGKTAMTDSTGWFEIVGVPIGRRQLRVSSCPAAQGIVEVTDEFTDTLEVRVPCKGR